MSARILIVDDMEASVKVLAGKLTAEFYDVVAALDGPTALEAVRTSAPDLVLLDVMMPGMDGFDVCRAIKRDPATAHVPVVMVTALNEPRDRVEGLEAGADDFLSKPVVDATLFARVRSLVRMKRTLDQWRQHEETSRALGFKTPGEISVDQGLGADIALCMASQIRAEDLRDLLLADHRQVTVLGDLSAAETEVAALSPHVVILGLGDDPMAALRLASKMRTMSETRSTPILLIGDEDQQDALIKGLEIGANDYVVRPADAREITARVRTLVRRKRYQDHLQETFVDNLSLALTDSLTGLHNHRYMESHLGGMLATAGKNNKATSLLVIDIDDFKSVNDNHGHDVGDQVLRQVGQTIMKNTRGFDLSARVGGDEFIVAMPDTPADIALAVAERIRGRVEDLALDGDGDGEGAAGGPVRVTLSIGVAEDNGTGETAESLKKRADEALYLAKRHGRNQVCPAPRHQGRVPQESLID